MLSNNNLRTFITSKMLIFGLHFFVISYICYILLYLIYVLSCYIFVKFLMNFYEVLENSRMNIFPTMFLKVCFFQKFLKVYFFQKKNRFCRFFIFNVPCIFFKFIIIVFYFCMPKIRKNKIFENFVQNIDNPCLIN